MTRAHVTVIIRWIVLVRRLLMEVTSSFRGVPCGRVVTPQQRRVADLDRVLVERDASSRSQQHTN